MWKKSMYLVLVLTVAGQVVIANSYNMGQMLWLVANIVAVCGDFVLKRETAAKVKDIFMLCLTVALMVWYNVFAR